MAQRSIIFVNRVYPPELAATGQILADLAEELVKAGWKVDVITSSSAGAPGTEVLRGVTVHRVGGATFTRSSHWKRALCYLSLYPVFLGKALRLAKPDCLVTMTDPPLQVVLSVLVKWLRGFKTVHWAQDVYPELARELGVLKRESLVLRLLTFISTFALRRQTAIVAVGSCMKQRLLDRGLDAEKIHVIPNWALRSLESQRPTAAFKTKHGLEGQFVVMYSGNFGLAHTFGEIIDAVRIVAKSNRKIVFVFAGGGPCLEEVRSALNGIGQVRFLPFQPQESLFENLLGADLHLVTVRPEASGLIVPSKVYGILAAGRPFLYVGPPGGEAAGLLKRYGCGRHISPGRGDLLAMAIMELAEDRSLQEAWEQGAQAARSEVSLKTGFERFAAVLNGVCGSG